MNAMHTTHTTNPAQPIAPFAAAARLNHALTANCERRALEWLARRMPGWVTSDQLTGLGLAAQIGAGATYALAGRHRHALFATILCLILNWFGDSLDGTLARVRRQLRPRFGFYVDHMVDLLGALAMMSGLGASGLVHWPIATAMLVAFLLLAAESYLATYTLARFHLSHGLFGPTEIRLLLIAGNVALLRNPYCTVFHHRLLLFDLGGAIASACMFATALFVTARHTAQLYRQEPIQ